MLRLPLLSAFLISALVLATQAADSTFNVNGKGKGEITPRTPQNRPVQDVTFGISQYFHSRRPPAPRNALNSRNKKRSPVFKRGRSNLRMLGKTTGMRIYQAGKGGKRGPWLKDGLKFCPRTWTTKGITISCATSGKVHHVQFFINKHLERTEVTHPYTIAGDRGGNKFAWTLPYYGEMTIGCQTQLHERIEFKVDFSCPKDAPPAPADSMRKAPASMSSSRGSGKSDAPTSGVETPKMMIRNGKGSNGYKKKNNKNKHRPSNKKQNSRPKPRPHSNKHKPKPRPRPSSNKQNKGKPKPIKNHSNSSSKPKGPVRFKRGYCMKLGAKGYRFVSGGLGAYSWFKTTNGMVFKPAFNGRRTFRPGKWLEYGIRVPVESHYGIVLDMTTKHWTEHNDVWLRWKNGRGIRLRKGKSSFVRGNNWIKAYHNKNGRAKASFSVDFRPHSFSTADVLKPGRTYSLYIAGRSSKVTVHRIIMFPCNGNNCHSGSGLWQRYLREC